jgi:hypothetical protein
VSCPGSSRRTSASSGWDHNWSRQYFYEDDAAPLLPAGTLVHVIAWFDNSAGNPRNVEPRNWKGYGNRAIDDRSCCRR